MRCGHFFREHGRLSLAERPGFDRINRTLNSGTPAGGDCPAPLIACLDRHGPVQVRRPPEWSRFEHVLVGLLNASDFSLVTVRDCAREDAISCKDSQLITASVSAVAVSKGLTD